MKWYRRAAENGNAEGQVRLGTLYEYGEGVTGDGAEAAHWYRRAADQGNALGQIRLRLLYGLGKGVPKDEPEEMSWLRKAADQDDAQGPAQFPSLHRGHNQPRSVRCCAMPLAAAAEIRSSVRCKRSACAKSGAVCPGVPFRRSAANAA